LYLSVVLYKIICLQIFICIFCLTLCIREPAFRQWRTVAIMVGCSPGSQPAQNCEVSLTVVVVAYHNPFDQLNRLAVDHNQATLSTYARTSTASGTNKN